MKQTLKKIRSNAFVNPFVLFPFVLLKSFGFRIPSSVYKHLPFVGEMTVRCQGQDFRLNSTGLFIENETYWNGLSGHEPETMRQWVRIVSSAKNTVLDLGANSGVFSLAAAAVGAEKVYAFEPVERIADIAASNFEINPTFNIVLVQSAVGDISGETMIYDPGGEAPTSASVNLEFSKQLDFSEDSLSSYVVPITTIDEYLRSKEVGRIGAVKIDIEGNEKAALRGMSDTIRTHRPVLIIEVLEPVAIDLQEELSKLVGIGYQVERIIDFQNGPNRNVICVPVTTPS